jgi:DNA polymerase
MARAVLEYVLGGKTGEIFSPTFSKSKAGTTQRENLTGSTTIKDIHQTISGSSIDGSRTETPAATAWWSTKVKKCARWISGDSIVPRWLRQLFTGGWRKAKALSNASETNASLVRVYDLVNCGPNHRFTILTVFGPLVVHNSGFGMGPNKFHLVTVPDKPLDFAEQCIETYRKEWAPLVPKLWYGLEEASAKAVWCSSKRAYEYRGITYQMRGNYLVCRLPSGREMFYCDPRKEQKAVPWDETDIRQAWSYLSFQGKGAHRKTPFGGLLCENLCQAAARDIMVAAMFRCEKEGLPVVFTVHDELVTEPEAKRNDALTVLQQCMEEREQWVIDFGIPVAAECDRMTSYQK